jgi:hypothetical protein
LRISTYSFLKAAGPADHPVTGGMLKPSTAPYAYLSHYYIKTVYSAIPLNDFFWISPALFALYRAVSSFDVLLAYLCILTSSLRAPLLPLSIFRRSVSAEYLTVCLNHPRIELWGISSDGVSPKLRIFRLGADFFAPQAELIFEKRALVGARCP